MLFSDNKINNSTGNEKVPLRWRLFRRREKVWVSGPWGQPIQVEREREGRFSFKKLMPWRKEKVVFPGRGWLGSERKGQMEEFRERLEGS